MPESVARIRDLPYYRVTAADLAQWIENQGDESWWSVDGDPVLTQRIHFPCPGDELSRELRHLGRPLLLLDVQGTSKGSGETISTVQLDQIAHSEQSGDRVLQLCWEHGPDVDWLLVEDTESAQRSLGSDDEE